MTKPILQVTQKSDEFMTLLERVVKNKNWSVRYDKKQRRYIYTIEVPLDL